MPVASNMNTTRRGNNRISSSSRLRRPAANCLFLIVGMTVRVPVHVGVEWFSVPANFSGFAQAWIVTMGWAAGDTAGVGDGVLSIGRVPMPIFGSEDRSREACQRASNKKGGKGTLHDFCL